MGGETGDGLDRVMEEKKHKDNSHGVGETKSNMEEYISVTSADLGAAIAELPDGIILEVYFERE